MYVPASYPPPYHASHYRALENIMSDLLVPGGVVFWVRNCHLSPDLSGSLLMEWIEAQYCALELILRSYQWPVLVPPPPRVKTDLELGSEIWF